MGDLDGLKAAPLQASEIRLRKTLRRQRFCYESVSVLP